MERKGWMLYSGGVGLACSFNLEGLSSEDCTRAREFLSRCFRKEDSLSEEQGKKRNIRNNTFSLFLPASLSVPPSPFSLSPSSLLVPSLVWMLCVWACEYQCVCQHHKTLWELVLPLRSNSGCQTLQERPLSTMPYWLSINDMFTCLLLKLWGCNKIFRFLWITQNCSSITQTLSLTISLT